MSDLFHSESEANGAITDLAERVRANQKKLASELKPSYDFIVASSGGPPLRRVCSPLCRFSIYVQSGREALQHELRPLGQKTIGPWNLRVYFPLPQLTESDSGVKKHVIDKTV
jgi:hypothetical protein